MKWSLRLSAVCTALLLVPMVVNSQPPGGEGGGRGGRGNRGFGGPSDGGQGGGRGGFGDPSQFFDRLSGGKNVIIIDQLDDRMKMMASRMAQTMGVTNGQITREQFNAGMEQFRAMRGNRGQGGPGGPGGGGQTVEVRVTGSPPGRPGEMSAEDMDRHAEDSFRKHDKNNDGQLELNEMPDSLKTTLANYDTNKDGLVSLEEFKGYYRDRIQMRMQEQGQGQPGQAPPADGLAPTTDIAPALEEEKRTAVYRFGKLPKEIPAWFVEMDVDKDGQIGLWEWVRVRGANSIDEFRAMDRNDDGLLTAEEVLIYVRANTKSPGNDAVASAQG
ncbi:MAG TPA: EF-hand domain-containing protein, partial [Gemmataceae bacterium]|nr:EF-hand domain-containing protein [Gemmataceae bacterium]